MAATQDMLEFPGQPWTEFQDGICGYGLDVHVAVLNTISATCMFHQTYHHTGQPLQGTNSKGAKAPFSPFKI
jgi:hypothetical protein